jgi:hypothetical protein
VPPILPEKRFHPPAGRFPRSSRSSNPHRVAPIQGSPPMAITRGVEMQRQVDSHAPSPFPSIFNLRAEGEFPVTPD